MRSLEYLTHITLLESVRDTESECHLRLDDSEWALKNKTPWGQSNSIMDRAFVLHLADTGLLSSIPHGPWSTSKSAEPEIIPKHHCVWPKNKQTKNKQLNTCALFAYYKVVVVVVGKIIAPVIFKKES